MSLWLNWHALFKRMLHAGGLAFYAMRHCRWNWIIKVLQMTRQINSSCLAFASLSLSQFIIYGMGPETLSMSSLLLVSILRSLPTTRGFFVLWGDPEFGKPSTAVMARRKPPVARWCVSAAGYKKWNAISALIYKCWLLHEDSGSWMLYAVCWVLNKVTRCLTFALIYRSQQTGTWVWLWVSLTQLRLH